MILWLQDKRDDWRHRFVRGPYTRAFFEFVSFGVKQAWACLFGGLMLGLLLGTYLFYPETAALARYDFITIVAVLIQLGMLLFRLETWDEAKVIFIFHAVGTVMELFKTQVGSWTYPEPAMLRIMEVPLFTGFMYACVGSYIARVWRLFDFQFIRFPPLWAQAWLAVAIYVNFFTHHYFMDVRILLFGIAALLYGPSIIRFRPDFTYRWMPLLLGLLLVALFIWFAENIATFARAWTCPSQETGWHLVSFEKFGSWFLLMIISFVLVAAVQFRSKPE
ncbi:hypothetical protein GCM10009069_25350 [Algimonas arctica]|uniref:DUF817 domain-containing protein n=1 Tax=Algimonas arctica TaxID=1479486 RepID=A0A8J3CSR8_9PROT|nr:DUF817 domain-containing protein [Algimonas arctica]GHB01408.1 hypothetical protein GCM10009069_25350 [Algimonas arctica]